MIRDVTPECIEVVCGNDRNPVFYVKESLEITLLINAYDEVIGDRLV